MTQSAPNSNASNHQWAGARWKIRRPFQKWRGEPTQNAPKKNRRPKQKKISTENTFANRSHRHGNPCIWRLPFDKDILPSTFLFPPHQLLLISGHSAGLFADWWKEKSFFFFFFTSSKVAERTNKLWRLSSGHTEIVTTFFFIWRQTKKCSFFDEDRSHYVRDSNKFHEIPPERNVDNLAVHGRHNNLWQANQFR